MFVRAPELACSQYFKRRFLTQTLLARSECSKQERVKRTFSRATSYIGCPAANDWISFVDKGHELVVFVILALRFFQWQQGQKEELQKLRNGHA